MEIICFHNPDEENAYLSNWYLCNFTVNHVDYTSLEQYMMHQKAVYFHDDKIAKEILATDDTAVIKQLGREVSGYNNHVWNGIRQVVVYEGLKAKFSQNEELKQKLLDTGDAMLVECSSTDRIWANGLSMYDPDRFDRSKWTGENLLGYAIMLVRERL